jgi:hypothetical protein
VVAGVVPGVIIGVALAAFFIYWLWRRSRVAAETQLYKSGPSSLPEPCQPRRADDSQPPNRPGLDPRRPSELGSELPELDSDPVSPTQRLHPVNESVDSERRGRPRLSAMSNGPS